jgi:hypothetical protein
LLSSRASEQLRLFFEPLQLHLQPPDLLDWGEWRFTALLLRPDGAIASVPLGEAAPIDAAISMALTATADNLADADNLWGDVTRLVFEPLQRQLAGSEELFLSPDGDLHRIPFAALPAPGLSGRLLSETVRW